MHPDRPRIDPPRTSTDLILGVLAVAGFLGFVAYVASSYAGLPDRIPVHFNASGAPDSFGPKASIWGLVAVGFVMQVIFLAVGLIKPWNYNIPVTITQANAEAAYLLTRRLLQFIRLEVTLLFAAIAVGMVMVATGRITTLSLWMLPAIIAPVFITIGVFLVMLFRLPK